MEHEMRREADATVVVLRGEVDLARMAEMKAVLEEAVAGATAVRVDAREVAAADLSALQLLLAAARTLREAGGSLSLRGDCAALESVARSGGLLRDLQGLRGGEEER